MNPLLLGVVLLLVLFSGAYAFVQINPATLARAIRTFMATFAMVAGTGLLVAGRYGLALALVVATVMAFRALRRGGGTHRRDDGGPAGQGKSSTIVTDTLAMELNHLTGELDGEVLAGRFAGRSLASLGLTDLLSLLADCQRDDPRSVPLLETFLDRHQPDWRSHVAGGHDDRTGQGDDPSEGVMDEATACSILNVPIGASAAEIKAAHRRLMTKLHPDHGGSSYLAAQLNQAKDFLLRR